MSHRPVGRKQATARATALLHQFEVALPPVPVEDICEDLGLAVVYETLPDDTSSLLIRHPNGQRVIGVNSRHAPRRQRFSLAHELGHALLHFHNDPPSQGDAVVSRRLEVLFRDGVAGRGTNAVEIDANVFAASLLMPEDLVRTRFRRRLQQDPARDIDDVIEDLADEFEVSTQAMRLRLVNLWLVDPA